MVSRPGLFQRSTALVVEFLHQHCTSAYKEALLFWVNDSEQNIGYHVSTEHKAQPANVPTITYIYKTNCSTREMCSRCELTYVAWFASHENAVEQYLPFGTAMQCAIQIVIKSQYKFAHPGLSVNIRVILEENLHGLNVHT